MVRSIIIDVIGIAGTASLFYGLYSFDPKIAYSVIGVLFIAFSIKAKA